MPLAPQGECGPGQVEVPFGGRCKNGGHGDMTGVDGQLFPIQRAGGTAPSSGLFLRRPGVDFLFGPDVGPPCIA